MTDEHGSVPVPDPTTLTHDAMETVKEDLRRDAEALSTLIDNKLAGRDRETSLLKELLELRITAQRDLITAQLGGFRELMDERKIAASEALAAALQAAKELVTQQNDANAKAADKAEANTTKLIDAIATLIKTTADAADARVAELKERMDRGEGGDNGRREQRVEYRDASTDRRLSTGAIVAMLTVGLFAVSVLASTLIAVFH
jgi:hypothetical protein